MALNCGILFGPVHNVCNAPYCSDASSLGAYGLHISVMNLHATFNTRKHGAVLKRSTQ